MKYSDTGNFNKKQRNLIKKFQKIAEELKKSGCVLVTSEYTLNIHLKKDWEQVVLDRYSEPDYDHPLKKESIEIINGGWDDNYFPMGYIDED